MPSAEAAPLAQAAPTPTRYAGGAKQPEPKRRTFLLIGSAVLILVVIGGWFLASNWSRMFPNSDPDPIGSGIAEPDPIARATRLHEEGKTTIAIAQLKRLAPDHPMYAEGQALIAQWEIPEPEVAELAEPSPEVQNRQEEIVSAARGAFGRGEYLRASELLEAAAVIGPLEGPALELNQGVEERLERLQDQIDLFRQGDWEYALPALWRIYMDSSEDRDVARLIVDSYFNLGVRDLQRGDPAAAAEKFGEALSLAPGDAELVRVADFTAVYQSRPPDLLYRIFVKYLPFR